MVVFAQISQHENNGQQESCSRPNHCSLVPDLFVLFRQLAPHLTLCNQAMPTHPLQCALWVVESFSMTYSNFLIDDKVPYLALCPVWLSG